MAHWAAIDLSSRVVLDLTHVRAASDTPDIATAYGKRLYRCAVGRHKFHKVVGFDQLRGASVTISSRRKTYSRPPGAHLKVPIWDG